MRFLCSRCSVGGHKTRAVLPASPRHNLHGTMIRAQGGEVDPPEPRNIIPAAVQGMRRQRVACVFKICHMRQNSPGPKKITLFGLTQDQVGMKSISGRLTFAHVQIKVIFSCSSTSCLRLHLPYFIGVKKPPCIVTYLK
jgi:hypothetical protein